MFFSKTCIVELEPSSKYSYPLFIEGLSRSFFPPGLVVAHRAATDDPQRGLPQCGQDVGSVDYHPALSNPALVSAFSKNYSPVQAAQSGWAAGLRPPALLSGPHLDLRV